MDLSFADTPAGYVDKISTFSRQDARGRVYRPLAEFLSKGTHNNHGNQSPDTLADCFAWYYAIYPKLPMSLIPLLSPSIFRDVDADSISSACGGRLVFLRGYPSPKWLAFLGHFYQIKPEYWRRHLDFLSLGDGTFPREYQLPSTTSRIFQFRVGSIGSWGRWWGLGQRIEDLNRSAATDMDRYLNVLGAGRGWKQADSIVRRYILHDKEHFSIEQNVTVYLHTENEASQWIVIVSLDCGDDLATSPEGPWLGGKDRNAFPRMLPAPKDGSDAILKTTRLLDTRNPAEQNPAVGTKLCQSLSHIHLNYGCSLDPDGRVKDPFYLLNELFQHDAFNESQMLDLIADKVKKHTIGTDLNMIEAADYKILHSRLLHFQRFLEHRIENLQDKLELIRRRGGRSWYRPEHGHLDELTKSATLSLVEDFEYLLKRAHNLLMRIERSISLTINLANIGEARRNTELNTTFFRFTVVASFYIPLSFTASFFGMNFGELGTGHLSIWVFFAVSIPILILSVIGLFFRRSWAGRLHRLLSDGFSWGD